MIWPKVQPPTHALVSSMFTRTEVAQICKLGAATIASKSWVPSNVVRVRPELGSLHDLVLSRIWESVVATNRLFQFDLVGIAQLLYCEYADGGSSPPHIDRSYGYKLSVTVQLSESVEYEGGDLRIVLGATTECQPVVASRNAGDSLVFPSYILHEVTPVIKGVRKCLVAWCMGPRFR